MTATLTPITVVGPTSHPLHAAFAGIAIAPRHDRAAIVVRLTAATVYIELTTQVLDRDNGVEWGIRSRREFPVLWFTIGDAAPRDVALREIRTSMHLAACHEVDECIREADGSRPFEPHVAVWPEVAA